MAAPLRAARCALRAAREGTLHFFRDSAAVRTTRQSSGMGTKPMRAQTAPEPWHKQGVKTVE